jgi:hypothetical protein
MLLTLRRTALGGFKTTHAVSDMIDSGVRP